MGKMIRIKRGLDSARQNYILELGELVWTIDRNELWVGDGLTSGGIKVTANIENNFIPNDEKGVANGVATLDANGLIPSNQLPAIALTDVFVVDNESEMVNLPAQTGDVAVRTDENKSYIKNNSNSGTINDWTELLTPIDSVQSVNGQTGTVVLNLSNINDVTFNSLNDGDFLSWDLNNSRWTNSNTIDGGTYYG